MRRASRDGAVLDYRHGELTHLDELWREYERVDLQVLVSKTYVEQLDRSRRARAWLRPLLTIGGFVVLPVWMLLALILCLGLLTLGVVGEALAGLVSLASLPLGLHLSAHGPKWLSERIEHSRGPARRATRRWIARTLDCDGVEHERLEQLIAELGRIPDPGAKYVELQREATQLRIEQPLSPRLGPAPTF